VAGAVHRAAAFAFGGWVVIPPGSVPPHLQAGLSAPMSQMQQPPLPPSITGPHGPALAVRVGPAGADVAQRHIHQGGTPDDLIEAAALSLRQAAMVNGALDPARYSAWVHQRLAFLSHIPDAAALFGTIEFAQHTIEIVMAFRASRDGVDQQSQGGPQSAQSPVPQSVPPSRPAPPANALMPVAQSVVPGGRSPTSPAR